MRPVPLEPGLGSAKEQRALLPEVLRFSEKQYGRYPFSSTGMVIQDLGVGYALETQTRPFFDGVPDDATLVHELAHALGLGYARYGRDKAEVLVDCVTYVVCSSVGLDVGGESIPYIAGWGEDGALDAIREYAETIDAVARRIEAALNADSTAATPAQRRRWRDRTVAPTA